METRYGSVYATSYTQSYASIGQIQVGAGRSALGQRGRAMR